MIPLQTSSVDSPLAALSIVTVFAMALSYCYHLVSIIIRLRLGFFCATIRLSFASAACFDSSV